MVDYSSCITPSFYDIEAASLHMKTKVAPETLSNVPYIFISLVIQLLFQNKVSVMQQ